MALITQTVPNLIGGVSQQSSLVRSPNQVEAMVNAYPSPVEGLVKRNPTEIVAEVLDSNDDPVLLLDETDAKIHLINRDANERYMVLIKDDDVIVYNTDGTQETVYNDGGFGYLTGADRDSLKALTVADVTFIVNTNTVPALDATKTTAINYNRIALVFIKQTVSDRTHTISLLNSAGNAMVDYTHKEAHAGGSDKGTSHAATVLAAAINGSNGYTAVAEDSVIKITRGSDFDISISDDQGGQGATLIRGEVQRFEDLPQTAPEDYVVRVVGAPENEIDDYYVKFEGSDGIFSRGIWRETVAPDLEYAYDYDTMPHVLIRQSDGSFMFKPADGTTPASNVPVGADYSLYKWAERAAGDDQSNSAPSFVGSTISNLVLFKNRLGFLSGENIVLSEVSEFFNFWRTTVLEIPDSEPIDISSSNPKVSVLKSGLVFNTELILFTDTTQFVLRGGEILSPSSVALLPVGNYESYGDIQPVSTGLSVYFGYSRGGGYSGYRELVPQPNIDGSYIVNTVSDIVPKYVVGKPWHIAATSQEDLVCVLADGDMFMYKFLRSGDQLLQNAWFKYTISDESGKADVIWAEFINDELYLLTLRKSTKHVMLEKMRLGVNLDDAGTVANTNWLTHLDCKKYYAAGTGTYSSVTGLTTWTLQKPLSYYNGSQIYTTNGIRITPASGTAYNEGTYAAGTVSARGDYSAIAVWIGLKYEMDVQLSQVWVQSGSRSGNAAVLTGRTQIRNINLSFEDTSFFKVEVVVGGENTYEYPYTANYLGSTVLNQISIEDGTFRFPVYSRNTDVVLSIKNDSALPCKLISAEYEIEYTDRAQRFA